MSYNVYRFEFTDLGDEARIVEYHISTAQVHHGDPLPHLMENLGAFTTIQEARKAVHKHAGRFRTEVIQSDSRPYVNGLVEAHRWGVARILTPHGTRMEYADWTYEVALTDDPETFALAAITLCREAIEQKISYPDRETLIAMMEGYREEILDIRRNAGW